MCRVDRGPRPGSASLLACGPAPPAPPGSIAPRYRGSETLAALRAVASRFGLVDAHPASAEILVVESLDGGIRLAVVVHLDEGETFRTAGFAIHDQVDARNGAELSERVAQLVLGDAVRQVSNINIHVTLLTGRNRGLSKRNARRTRPQTAPRLSTLVRANTVRCEAGRMGPEFARKSPPAVTIR